MSGAMDAEDFVSGGSGVRLEEQEQQNFDTGRLTDKRAKRDQNEPEDVPGHEEKGKMSKILDPITGPLKKAVPDNLAEKGQDGDAAQSAGEVLKGGHPSA